MAKFILPYNIPSTPSPFGTAPVGHWGPYSPDPLRRSAPMGSFWVRLYWYIHLSKSKDFV